MTTSEASEDGDYEVRPYAPDDREPFRSLYGRVFGEERSEAWFAWKYEDNPYVDHVPAVVATDDDELVGARGLFALPMAAGVDDERRVALQPCDTMVHPDHRRQGLFRRMTRRAIERYRGEHPFFFNFPNRLTLRGNLELGWQVVSERSTHYRIEDPAAIAGDGPLLQLAGRVGAPLLRGYYRLRERASAPSPEVPVRAERRLPAAELAELYRRAPPERIHAARDEEFYRWRLGNPDWEYTVYLAGEGDPEAAVVAGTSTRPGATTTRLADVVPLEAAPERALVALVERVLADHDGTALFAAPDGGFPEAVLRQFGFRADTSLALSRLATPTRHVVRSLTGEWTRNGLDLTGPDDWLVTFLEEDTG